MYERLSYGQLWASASRFPRYGLETIPREPATLPRAVGSRRFRTCPQRAPLPKPTGRWQDDRRTRRMKKGPWNPRSLFS